MAEQKSPEESRAAEAEAEAERRAALIELRRRRRRATRHMIEQAIGGASHEFTRACAAIGGAALIGYGAWLAWPPAGFVAGGALLIAGVWLHDRNGG